MTETWSPDDIHEAWLKAVAVWNVFGLPALLGVVAAVALVRARAAEGASWLGRRGVVLRIGRIHDLLALWSLLTVADELWAARGQGFSRANPFVVVPALGAVIIDGLLGRGLRRFRPAARWVALVVAALRWTLAVWLTVTFGAFGGSIDPTEWPRLAVSRVLPAFLFVALLLPATARVFQARGAVDPPPGKAGAVLALGSRLFVVLLGSIVLIDALDLAIRAAVESMSRA